MRVLRSLMNCWQAEFLLHSAKVAAKLTVSVAECHPLCVDYLKSFSHGKWIRLQSSTAKSACIKPNSVRQNINFKIWLEAMTVDDHVWKIMIL